MSGLHVNEISFFTINQFILKVNWGACRHHFYGRFCGM